MLYLDLFKKLGRMRGPNITIGTETKIFESYDRLIGTLAPRDRKTVVVAHCHDEVIMSHGLRDNLANLDRDLERNPNVHVILISCYDIEQHLPRRPNFLFIPFWEYHGIYWHLYANTEPADPSKISKRFLSLNKRADVHRQLLYYKFYQMDLLDDNVFSYLCEDYVNGSLLDPKSYVCMHGMIKSFPGMERLTIDPPSQGKMLADDLLLQQYQSGNHAVDPTWVAHKQWYDQTFCSIVIETDAGDDHVNLSEKTFRCIAMQHPIMLFAAEGTNQFLGKLGIDITFDELGWDDMGELRLKNMFDKIEQLARIDMSMLRRMRYSMQEKLEQARKSYSILHGRIVTMEAAILQQVTAKINSWHIS